MDVSALIGSAFSDILSYFNVPGASLHSAVVGGVVGMYLKRRLTESQDILIEEFAKAKISQIDVASKDDLGGVLFRYYNSVRENAARINLRLMAKAMTGQARCGELYADDFFRYAHLLSALHRDEVIVVTLVHQQTAVEKASTPSATSHFRDDAPINLISKKAGMSVEKFMALCQSSSRTGLIYKSLDMNTFPFLSTVLMDELVRLIDFEDALRSEGADL